ncbi:diacylglycerol kinase family protein [Streptomyces sp. MST-110588]|uniref:diacylglycerol/lipid kinase family protein n=1 Tax=Streptomyces sp. MST-110588 TaxID=2833628 RepID=UPI001F5D20AB|nr:diacylglycerol kinase family protein [Streptomyces sp. MST-110588]UNO38470.1 hypothetical protein KGS77_00920 [Streptomyces sp. MST-110588]
MRGTLIVNPASTGAGDAVLRAVLAELTPVVRLDVAVTACPGHAFHLARAARRDGVRLVAVLGGDGTVNEAVNGLLADGWDAGPHHRPAVPALGILPAGGLNVAARALGLGRHAVPAARRLAEAVGQGRRTVVNLGKADHRYFLTAAGVGFGAELMALVQQGRQENRCPPGRRQSRWRQRGRGGGRSGAWSRYLMPAARHFLSGTDRRVPALSVALPQEEPQQRAERTEGVFALLVANTSPYAYMGRWPLAPCPAASFQDDLEALAFTDLSTHRCAALLARMLLRPRHEHNGRPVRRFAGRQSLSVTVTRPVAVHVDGEVLTPRREVRFSSTRGALAVAL